MADIEKVIKGLEMCIRHGENAEVGCGQKNECPYEQFGLKCWLDLNRDALAMLKEQEKEIKALRLLVEWAEECDFGFDQFPDEYERYKDEIKDMKYIDGMIHVAKRTLEDHGAFEEGR